jgi:hypothetical protein
MRAWEALVEEVARAHRAWNELRMRHAAAISDAQALQAEREALIWKSNELARLGFESESVAETDRRARSAHPCGKSSSRSPRNASMR